MKGNLSALIFSLLVTSSFAAEQTANMKLYSTSIMILPAIADDPQFGLEYRMEVTTASETEPANGELAQIPDTGEDIIHGGIFLLEDPILFEKIPMVFNVTVPNLDDTNANGVPDFFELELEASGDTTGIYEDWDGSIGQFSANWGRAAGDVLGGLVLHFPDYGLTFRHTFVLLQYNGTYTYTRNGSQVTGTVAMERADNPPDVLQGPLNMTVDGSDNLSWSSATWIDGLALEIEISNSGNMTRRGLLFTEYFTMSDGFTGSNAADFLEWFMVLTTGDEDGDAIPDILDVPQQGEPPSLVATLKDGELELQLRGMDGQSYTLERVDALPAKTAQWVTVQTVEITANPTTVTLPVNAGNSFFRLRQ